MIPRSYPQVPVRKWETEFLRGWNSKLAVELIPLTEHLGENSTLDNLDPWTPIWNSTSNLTNGIRKGQAPNESADDGEDAEYDEGLAPSQQGRDNAWSSEAEGGGTDRASGPDGACAIAAEAKQWRQ